MRRDWTDAHAKIEAEGHCRIGERCHGRVEAAHVIGRKHDEPIDELAPRVVLYVHPDDVVPLCTRHHRLYDAHDLDICPYLSLAEQARAALHVGLVRALARTTGHRA